MFYPLDSRNTKKPKTKMLSFYKQQSYFSHCLKKSQNINIIFLWKIHKITILFWVLVFSFMYLVSVDAKDRSKIWLKNDIWWSTKFWWLGSHEWVKQRWTDRLKNSWKIQPYSLQNISELSRVLVELQARLWAFGRGDMSTPTFGRI